MIVADTNIISTFTRIKRLELLLKVAETDALHLAPAVVKEIEVGLRKGLDFTPDEKSMVDALPGSLNAGEKESIAICSKRAGCKLLTNDKRAHNYCRANRIPSLDLKLILRQLWKASHCTKEEVCSLMEE